jgi:lipid A oxidase
MNTNFSSTIKTVQGGVNDTRKVDWQGKSFQMPPYWGARLTYWFKENQPGLGFSVDYTHAKAYGNVDFTADPVFDHLEFTDGLNLLIFSPMWRFPGFAGGKLIPYTGIGLGIAIPHVEVELDAFPANKTRKYEVTGIASHVLAGLEYRFLPHWSLFAEGKMSYARIDGDLNGGGSVITNIWSPQLALGLSVRF